MAGGRHQRLDIEREPFHIENSNGLTWCNRCLAPRAPELTAYVDVACRVWRDGVLRPTFHPNQAFFSGHGGPTVCLERQAAQEQEDERKRDRGRHNEREADRRARYSARH